MRVHVVVPDGIRDPARPSGGNVYDRRLVDGLRDRGHDVHEHPSSAARLDATLARIADASTVVVDGLVGCFAPVALERHRDRLRLVLLAHMAFGEVDPGSRASEGRAVAAADCVATVSAWARERLLAGRPDVTRVHVVEPGADPAPPAAPDPAGRRLLVVGAVTRSKGLDVLVEALALVGDLDWTCTVVGPLDRDPVCAGIVRAAPRLRLTGPLSGSALAREYAAADLLVEPSRSESFGIVVVEALARGVPVLATEVGGVPEALGGPSGACGGFPESRAPGRLVPPAEAPALAAALRAWLTDPEERSALRAAAAHRRTGVTGWDTTVRRFEEVLEDAVAGVGW